MEISCVWAVAIKLVSTNSRRIWDRVFMVFVHFMADGLGGTHRVSPAKPHFGPVGDEILTDSLHACLPSAEAISF